MRTNIVSINFKSYSTSRNIGDYKETCFFDDNNRLVRTHLTDYLGRDVDTKWFDIIGMGCGTPSRSIKHVKY